jgi:hypothetical protein
MINVRSGTAPFDKRASYSFHAALYRVDILELGVAGFTEWLIDSFAGPEPVQRPGRFQYAEDIWFCDAVALVAREFQDDVLNIARPAVRDAIASFSKSHLHEGTYVGLYVLASVAESFAAKGVMPMVAHVLQRWLPPRATAFRPPKGRDDVVALRELLECAYRDLTARVESGGPPHNKPIEPRHLSSLREISRWSNETLGSPRQSRALTPAMAPMYYLAIAHHVVFNKLHDGLGRFDVALSAGPYRNGDPNEELYEFPSAYFPNERFPYDIDTILRDRKTFTAFLNGVPFVPDSYQRLLNTSDPFAGIFSSATHAARVSNEDPDEVHDGIMQEMLT